jgi:hypothetical protein
MTKEELAELENPNIGNERLREVYERYHDVLRDEGFPHIAVHPNTPLDILRSLFVLYPKDVLRNPAFSLILVEDPTFFHDMPDYSLLQILDDCTLPKYIIPFLQSKNGNFAMEVQHHIALGEAKNGWENEVADDIARLDSSSKIKYLEEYQMIPAWLDLRLCQIESEETPAIPAKPPLNNSPSIDDTPLTEPEKEALRLMTAPSHTTYRKRWQYVRNTRRIVELEYLIGLGDSVINQELARDHNTPPHLLTQLAENKSLWYPLATNLNTPVEILRKISQNPQHQNYIAQNPNTPEDVIQQYLVYAQKNQKLADKIFSNSHIPKELWEKIFPYTSYAKHGLPKNILTEEEFVDYFFSSYRSNQQEIKFLNIIISRNTPSLQLKNKVLTNCSHRIVYNSLLRFVLLSQTNKKPSFNRTYEWWHRFAIIINPNTKEKIIAQWVDDVDRYVRAAARVRLADPEWRFNP